MANSPAAMVVNLEEQFSANKKRQRKIKRWIFVIVIIIVIVLFVWGAWWFVFRSGVFLVEAIVVRGNKKISQEEVVQALEPKIIGSSRRASFLGARHMLSWPEGALTIDLTDTPIFKSAAIEKNYQEKKIIIHVVEREPYGVWCRETKQGNVLQEALPAVQITSSTASSSPERAQESTLVGYDSQCMWFDDDGTLYQQALAVQGSLIRAVYDYSGNDIALNAKILPEELISNLFSIFDALSRAGVSVQEVRYEDPKLQEVRVTTHDGPELYFGLRFSALYAPEVVLSLREKGELSKLKYIDFRVENRAYYR